MLKLNFLVFSLWKKTLILPVSSCGIALAFCQPCLLQQMLDFIAAIFLSKVPSLFTLVSCTRVSFYIFWILAALVVSKVLNFFCLVLYNSSWNCQPCFFKQFFGFSTLFLATVLSSDSLGLCNISWVFFSALSYSCRHFLVLSALFLAKFLNFSSIV